VESFFNVAVGNWVFVTVLVGVSVGDWVWVEVAVGFTVFVNVGISVDASICGSVVFVASVNSNLSPGKFAVRQQFIRMKNRKIAVTIFFTFSPNFLRFVFFYINYNRRKIFCGFDIKYASPIGIDWKSVWVWLIFYPSLTKPGDWGKRTRFPST